MVKRFGVNVQVVVVDLLHFFAYFPFSGYVQCDILVNYIRLHGTLKILEFTHDRFVASVQLSTVRDVIHFDSQISNAVGQLQVQFKVLVDFGLDVQKIRIMSELSFLLQIRNNYLLL